MSPTRIIIEVSSFSRRVATLPIQSQAVSLNQQRVSSNAAGATGSYTHVTSAVGQSSIRVLQAGETSSVAQKVTAEYQRMILSAKQREHASLQGQQTNKSSNSQRISQVSHRMWNETSHAEYQGPYRVVKKSRGFFLFHPLSTKIFECKFPRNFHTSLIKSKLFFNNRKLTSLKIVFCLNKTFFTHHDYNYVQIKFFRDSKQEVVEFLVNAQRKIV